MDHGNHGSSMPMGPRCSMNMLWNTNIVDTCIIFRQWHISSTASFIFSFLIILGLGIFYEYLRTYKKSIDIRIAASLSKGKTRISSPNGSGRSTPEINHEDSRLLTRRHGIKPGTPVPLHFRAVRALLYGATVFLSFFLMLVFMTYNAYLIMAVVVGAAIGHYVFEGEMDVDAVLSGSGEGNSLACH